MTSTFCLEMKKLQLPFKIALSDFLIDLQKGLIDDERWNWNLDQADWSLYQKAYLDPTIMRTTLAVWMNTVEMDEAGVVTNRDDAAFRAFQYFRYMFDRGYSQSKEAPTFEAWEVEEPF